MQVELRGAGRYDARMRRAYRWLCEYFPLIALLAGVVIALVLSCFKYGLFGG